MPAPDFTGAERLIHDIERQQRASQERIRDILREEGRPDLVAKFDAQMRDVATGVTHARSVWHSISEAQRTILGRLVLGGRLVRRGAGYVVDGSGRPLSRPARLATLRAMERHGLLDWTGGAFDPEGSAVLSEKGRFVHTKGQPTA